MSLLDKLHRNDQALDQRPEEELRKLFRKGKRKEREREHEQHDDHAAERLANVAISGNPVASAARAIVGGADPIAPITGKSKEIGGRVEAATKGDLGQSVGNGDLSAAGGPNVATGGDRVQSAANAVTNNPLASVANSLIGGANPIAPLVASATELASRANHKHGDGQPDGGATNLHADADVGHEQGGKRKHGGLLGKLENFKPEINANIGGFDVHVDAKPGLDGKRPKLDVHAEVDGKIGGVDVHGEADTNPLAKKKELSAKVEANGKIGNADVHASAESDNVLVKKPQVAAQADAHGQVHGVPVDAEVSTPDALAKKKKIEASANVGGVEIGQDRDAGGRFEAVQEGMADRSKLGKQVVDAAGQVTNGDLMWNAMQVIHDQAKDEALADGKTRKKGSRFTQVALGHAEDKASDKIELRAGAQPAGDKDSANDKDVAHKKAKRDVKHDHALEAKHDGEATEHEEEETVDGKKLPGKVGKFARQAHDELKQSDGHTTGIVADGKHRLEQHTVDGHGMGVDLGPKGAKNATHTPDGHGMGVDLGPNGAKNATHTPDGHGMGVDLSSKVDAKHGPNQKVDGHGTGLDLDPQPLHKQQVDAEHHHDEIVDADGEKHQYNPHSGVAPAPKASGHATGGFQKPPPKPQLPPPPQTANQQALNAFIEKARHDRDTAKGAVKHQQLAKSTALTVDANHIAAQVKRNNDTKLAAIKKQADESKAKAAQEAAEKKKSEGPVTLESLKTKLEATATEDKAKLQTDFDAKAAELKTRLESQKAVLQQQTTDQIAHFKTEQDNKKKDAEKAWTEQQASLKATRDGLLTQIRKSVAEDQAKLEKEMAKDGKLWVAANKKMADIEATTKTNAAAAKKNGEDKSALLVKNAGIAADAERSKGQAAATAAKNADGGDDAKAKAASAPFEARAKDFETKAKLDAKAMKADADKQCAKIEDDGKKAKEAVNTATANQVKAIETKIQDLGKIADGKIKAAEESLKAKLAAGEAKLKDTLKGSEDKINKLKTDADAKIAKLETESLGKLQKDFDAAMTALDKRVDAARKQLAQGNEKNLKALEKMVDQTCKAIDKQVVDTEKKFDHTVQDADKKASAHVLAALSAIKAEAEKALHAIDLNYQEALKMADDAAAGATRQMEETAKGKMLEIEVHVGTMMKDCGDSSRYDATYKQLRYYIENKLPIPAGYGEAAPAPSEGKKEEKPGEPAAAATAPKTDEKKPELGEERKKLEKEETDRAELLKPENMSEAGIKAKVEEAIKKGQKQTAVGAAADAKHDLRVSMADATDAMSKTFKTKSEDLDKLKNGDTTILKQVHDQQAHEQAGADAAKAFAAAKDSKKSWYGSKSPDKQAIMKSLEGRTPEEIEAMREVLKRDHNIDLDDFLKKELSGAEAEEAAIRLKGDPVAGDIFALKHASGHQRTGNEKLTMAICGGPSAWIQLASEGDQNTGADKKRMEEILAKYKAGKDPESQKKFEAFKTQYEAETGQSLGDVLHRSGEDALAKDLNVEVKKDKGTKKEIEDKAKKDADDLFLKSEADPKTKGKIDQNKVGAQAVAIESALNGFHLDSTKVDSVREALKQCTPEEMAYLKLVYKQKTGKDLDRELETNLSGAGLAEAKATLRNDKETAAVNKILGAEDSGWTPWTLDDKKMNDTLKELKDPAERRAVLAAYEKRTGRKLQDALAEKMTGNDRDLAVALADGDELKARNVELDEATNGGWMNGMHRAIHDRTQQVTGKDINTEKYTRGVVNAYLDPAGVNQDKQSVPLPGGYVMENGSIHKVDSDKIFELLENTPNPEDRQKLKDLYFQRTGRKLDDDMGTKLVGPMGGKAKLDAYKALDDGRMDDYAAAKMDDAVDGLNDSKAFHKQLEGKSEAERKRIIDAYNKRHPGQPDAFNKMLDEQFGADSMDKKKAKLLAESPDDPMTGSVKLPDKFVLEYAQDSVWNRTAKSIDKVTAVMDKYPMLYAIPGVGSAAMNAKTASYFMRGWGVDNDAIKDVLKGKSKDEIAALKAQYPDLEKDLMYALSGRDAFEVKLMLEDGEPKTDKEKIERRMKLYEFDRGGSGSYLGLNKVSNALTDAISPDGKMMDSEYESMKAQLEILKKGGTLPPEAQRQLELSLGSMDQSTKGFIAAREEMTGAIATAVGAVVGAVVTVLTGGVAGAILAALATGMATVGTKLVMLGESYGRSEMGVDLAMTAVQMATAGLGHGVGKLSQSFLTQVLNGAIGAAASNFAQTAMTSKDAHDLLGLLAQASKSGLVGMLSGGANAAATAGLASAMGALSKKAFGPDAPLTGVLMKGFVSGAGGSLAGTFAEAMVDPDTLSGNWDQVFAKLARGAAEAGMQNSLSEVAGEHRDRTEKIHTLAHEAVAKVQEENKRAGRERNIHEEQAAFAKVMSEGYDAVIRQEEAKAAAAKQAQAAPNPDQVLKQREEHAPAQHEEPKPAHEDPRQAAKEEKPAGGKTSEEIKAHMDELAATKHAEEQKSAQSAKDEQTGKPADEHAKPADEQGKVAGEHDKPAEANGRTPEEQHGEEQARAKAEEEGKAKRLEELDPAKVAKATDAPAAGTGQMPAVAPAAPFTHLIQNGQGLASAAAMEPFIHAMREHAEQWPTMNGPQKARVIQDAINAVLAEHGLPATTVKAAGGGYGVMNSAQGGGIHISPERLAHGSLAEVVNTAYHEARHLEQWHLAVKHLQESGWTADQIVQKTGMHPGIVHESMNHPGQITPAQMAEGKRFFDAIYGSGAANREQAYQRKASSDPHTAFLGDQQYRRLPEEVDAYRVGDAAQHAFLHAPAAPVREPMPNTSGPIEPMPIYGIGGDKSASGAGPIKPDPIIPIGPHGPEVTPPAHVDAPVHEAAQTSPSGRKRSNTAPMAIPDSMKTPPPASLTKHPRSGLVGDGVSSKTPTLHGVPSPAHPGAVPPAHAPAHEQTGHAPAPQAGPEPQRQHQHEAAPDSGGLAHTVDELPHGGGTAGLTEGDRVRIATDDHVANTNAPHEQTAAPHEQAPHGAKDEAHGTKPAEEPKAKKPADEQAKSLKQQAKEEAHAYMEALSPLKEKLGELGKAFGEASEKKNEILNAFADQIAVKHSADHLPSESVQEHIKEPADKANLMALGMEVLKHGLQLEKYKPGVLAEGVVTILGKVLEAGLKATGHHDAADLIGKLTDMGKLQMSTNNPVMMEHLGLALQAAATGRMAEASRLVGDIVGVARGGATAELLHDMGVSRGRAKEEGAKIDAWDQARTANAEHRALDSQLEQRLQQTGDANPQLSSELNSARQKISELESARQRLGDHEGPNPGKVETARLDVALREQLASTAARHDGELSPAHHEALVALEKARTNLKILENKAANGGEFRPDTGGDMPTVPGHAGLHLSLAERVAGAERQGAMYEAHEHPAAVKAAEDALDAAAARNAPDHEMEALRLKLDRVERGQVEPVQMSPSELAQDAQRRANEDRANGISPEQRASFREVDRRAANAVMPEDFERLRAAEHALGRPVSERLSHNDRLAALQARERVGLPVSPHEMAAALAEVSAGSAAHDRRNEQQMAEVNASIAGKDKQVTDAAVAAANQTPAVNGRKEITVDAAVSVGMGGAGAAGARGDLAAGHDPSQARTDRIGIQDASKPELWNTLGHKPMGQEGASISYGTGGPRTGDIAEHATAGVAKASDMALQVAHQRDQSGVGTIGSHGAIGPLEFGKLVMIDGKPHYEVGIPTQMQTGVDAHGQPIIETVIIKTVKGVDLSTGMGPARELQTLEKGDRHAQLTPEDAAKLKQAKSITDNNGIVCELGHGPQMLSGEAALALPADAFKGERVLGIGGGPTSVWAMEHALTGGATDVQIAGQQPKPRSGPLGHELKTLEGTIRAHVMAGEPVPQELTDRHRQIITEHVAQQRNRAAELDAKLADPTVVGRSREKFQQERARIAAEIDPFLGSRVDRNNAMLNNPKMVQLQADVINVRPIIEEGGHPAIQVTYADGSTHVVDRVIPSIGADPDAPGGIHQILKNAPSDMKLVPVISEGRVVGLESEPGGISISGAAMMGTLGSNMPPEVMKRIPPEMRDAVVASIIDHAYREGVSAGSRGIVPGIENVGSNTELTVEAIKRIPKDKRSKELEAFLLKHDLRRQADFDGQQRFPELQPRSGTVHERLNKLEGLEQQARSSEPHLRQEAIDHLAKLRNDPEWQDAFQAWRARIDIDHHDDQIEPTTV